MGRVYREEEREHKGERVKEARATMTLLRTQTKELHHNNNLLANMLLNNLASKQFEGENWFL